MQFSSFVIVGRAATWLAGVFSPPYKGRRYLAKLNKRGYFSPSAAICCKHLSSGANVFIGDRVTIYDAGEGQVLLGDRASIHQDSVIEVGMGGRLIVGKDTHIQPRCQISAYKGTVAIGENVQIAPGCAFYPYNHGIAAGESIQRQPLQTKGGLRGDCPGRCPYRKGSSAGRRCGRDKRHPQQRYSSRRASACRRHARCAARGPVGRSGAYDSVAL
jgi:acetyltransferase-like isoleucine patch superfamily enzyme